MKYHENILKGFRVMVCTKFYNFGSLWEITPEPSRLELSFLHMTLLPNALYNLTKFHKNSSKGIGVMGRTRFCLQTDGRTETDGQTDTRAIAISPEPFSQGIKRDKSQLDMYHTKLVILLLFSWNSGSLTCKVTSSQHRCPEIPGRLWNALLVKTYSRSGDDRKAEIFTLGN